MKGVQLTAVSVITGLMLVAGAYGQEQGKMGFVDLSKLFDEYQKTKEYDAALEAKHKGFEQERNKMVDKLRDAQNKSTLLKDPEKKKLEEEIDKQRNEIMEFDRQKKTDLTKERDEKIREILLEIEKIVSDYAVKNNYTLILNDRVLIYGNQTMNLTEPILKLLNESYNKKQAEPEKK